MPAQATNVRTRDADASRRAGFEGARQGLNLRQT